jgi:hypothetical protein
MKHSLGPVGWILVCLLLLCASLVGAVQVYHSRRFRACSEELETAVRAGKTFEAFTRDPRPDGLLQRYSPERRGELLAEVKGWGQTTKDASDIDAMSKRAHTSAIFLFHDMVYVLFFDREDRLREFVCLSN